MLTALNSVEDRVQACAWVLTTISASRSHLMKFLARLEALGRRVGTLHLNKPEKFRSS